MVSEILFPSGFVKTENVIKSIELVGTPHYLYDEQLILQKCEEIRSMPNTFGINPRYAMKANSTKAILQIIANQGGLSIDASSLNEAKRANLAGIDYSRIMLTTQEVPLDEQRTHLENMVLFGMKYNACSLRQLELISSFVKEHNIPIAMRVHPGVGSGESATRNTGDKYSCFGIHLSNLPEAIRYAKKQGIVIDHVHVHIGSGGDPLKWKENINRELEFVEQYFPDARVVNFGGGLKEARMPGECSANLKELGEYAKDKINKFYTKTGRKLLMEVEPGTMIVANSGYTVTSVIDIKQTGQDGFEFIILNGGMEANTRQLLYGSEHPIYVLSREGELLSSEFDKNRTHDLRVPVGRCCESGDAQRLDSSGHIIPISMARPKVGDYVLVGGSGAYCSTMSPFNYNSHEQIPEVLFGADGTLQIIRKRQSLEQLIQNENNL